MGASLQVCFHEAGHAFIAWYFGVRLRKVAALSDKEFARRKWFKTHGGKIQKNNPGMSEHFEDMFSPKRIHSTHIKFDKKKICRLRIYIALAGPLNTELVTGLTLQNCLSSSGWGDKQMIDACRAWAKIGDKEYNKIISDTRNIMGSLRAQACMRDITLLLMSSGKVSGERVRSLCVARYGTSTRVQRIVN